MLGLIALLAFPPAARCDVFKYVDAAGNVYFTDSPLKGHRYELEWRRTAAKLVSEQGKTLVAAGTRRLAPPPVQGSPRDLAIGRARYSALIDATARDFNLHPELLRAMIRTESGYNPSAVSSAGASGLMQLMPAYNAGENAVIKYGYRIPPYPETQQYVRKVLQFLWAERTSAGS
ncbi:MAG: lytic transglycosylase domain-containing protein [Chromatiaceae bacterium]